MKARKTGGRRLALIGRYQLKIAAAYLSVIAVILTLLNTYPLFMTQTIVFRYKHSAMNASASLMAAGLQGLDRLTPEDVGKLMGGMDERRGYRVIVCNEEALSVYDSSLRDSTEGKTLVFEDITAALAGSEVFTSRYVSPAFESRFTLPVMSRGRLTGALYLYDRDPEQASLLSDLQSNLSIFSVVISGVILLVTILISMLMSHRLGGLLRAVRALRDGDLGRKAPVHGKDELAEVAVRFNELSERLYNTEELRRQFVSDASHELKTPLASVKLLTDSILLADNMKPETLREFLTDISDEIDRLTRLAEGLISLARSGRDGPGAETRQAEPAEVITRAAHMLQPYADKSGVELRLRLSETPAASVAPDDLYTVVYNLLENGVKYNKSGGYVECRCSGGPGGVTLVVEDNGMGISKDEQARIFERFYRVDKTRSRQAGGSGLGLSIVEHTLARAGGTIAVESEPDKGTVFTITLPAAKE